MRWPLALAGLLASSSMAVPPAIPGTSAGRFFRSFLSAYNSGDAVQLQRYNDRYHRTLPPQAWIDRHADTGDLLPLRVEVDEPNRLTILVTAADSDDLVRETIKMDPADPTRVLKFIGPAVDRAPGDAIARLSRAEAAAALEGRAVELTEADKFASTMIVMRGGQRLIARGWGLADRERRAPVRLDTKFRIGSDNKMFTAVAVLQLVEAGKLALDGTVGRYLPDYPNRDFANGVTIRELLTHTGGAGDIFGPEFDAHRADLTTNGDYVRLYGTRAPDRSPEGRNSYSNYGFVLLGHIVERVSGEDYYAYLDRHIFRPAGMIGTGSLPETMAVPGRAPGYTHSGTALVGNADTLPYRGMAAGGGYSTAPDLVRFAQALRAGRLISHAMLQQATSPQNPGKWYGFGFEVHGTGVDRYWGHGGGAPGMNAAVRVYPKTDTVIVVLSNIDPPGADKLATFYANRMPPN